GSVGAGHRRRSGLPARCGATAASTLHGALAGCTAKGLDRALDARYASPATERQSQPEGRGAGDVCGANAMVRRHQRCAPECDCQPGSYACAGPELVVWVVANAATLNLHLFAVGLFTFVDLKAVVGLAVQHFV